jgi:hypothetical protein
LPLNLDQLADADALGIENPERVRVLYVTRVPLPSEGLVRATRFLTGAAPGPTAGLAAGYGVFIDATRRHDRPLLAHELAHVRQYERCGGIRPFLREYLESCFVHGYAKANFELEAKSAAQKLTQAA